MRSSWPYAASSTNADLRSTSAMSPPSVSKAASIARSAGTHALCVTSPAFPCTGTELFFHTTIQLATYDSGTVSTQLDANRIDQLPQNGRSVLGLAQNTVPGLEAGGTRPNGLMQEGMEYSQDGAPMTNRNSEGKPIQTELHSQTRIPCRKRNLRRSIRARSSPRRGP
jgi:hypothetical protein